jgi:hypothetical protein
MEAGHHGKICPSGQGSAQQVLLIVDGGWRGKQVTTARFVLVARDPLNRYYLIVDGGWRTEAGHHCKIFLRGQGSSDYRYVLLLADWSLMPVIS